jgi:replicative superfamily II helicase
MFSRRQASSLSMRRKMIANASRGANLEYIMTLIRMRRREGIELQVVTLSAVIGDTGGMESWLGGRLLRRNERPVPLAEGVLCADGSFRYLDPVTGEELVERGVMQRQYGKNTSQDWIIPLVRKLVAEGQLIIVFRETKGEARSVANYIPRGGPWIAASDGRGRTNAYNGRIPGQ